MDYAIEIEELTKTYSNRFTAISNLTLKIPRGVFGFLGHNGAGKSTTIGILVGAMRPTSGTALILGHDIIKDSLEARKLIGFLPERIGLYDDMSGYGFLCYMGELGRLSSGKASQRAKELLEWVSLAEWAHSPIGTFSAGMRQRIGLAQALINDPEVIFLDEPTANLDPLGRADFADKVKELAQQGKTIFLSSHIIPEVERIAEYVAIIDRGRLVVEGSVEELTQPGEFKKYLIEVTNPAALHEELQTKAFVLDSRLEKSQLLVITREEERLAEALLQFCTENKVGLRQFEPVKRDLQTVFSEALRSAKTDGTESNT